MAYFTFNTSNATTLHQKHLFFITLCKFSSSLNFFNHRFLSYLHTPLVVVRSSHAKIKTSGHEGHLETVNYRTREEAVSGFSALRDNNKRVERKSLKKFVNNSVMEEKGESNSKNMKFKRRRQMDSVDSKMRSKDGYKERNGFQNVGSEVVNGEMKRENKKGGDNRVKGDRTKKHKADPTEVKLRVRLDMCSKRGDVMGAIQLYDLAQNKGIKMGQYHYNVLLYLCSSAALGVVQPAKSGNENRSSKVFDIFNGNSSVKSAELNDLVILDDKNVSRLSCSSRICGSSDKMEVDSNGSFNELNSSSNDDDLEKVTKGSSKLNSDQLVELRKDNDSDGNDHEIQISEDIKKYALQRGLEIYDKMCKDNIPMSEASLTAVARMAISMGDGDMAFDMVKKMTQLGINPKLRSYGPALSVYCNSGDVDRAFAVEKHMLEHGILPEESELEALLRVSVEAGKGDNVYYLLHKLRTTVRQVSPSTAGIIVKWFKSTVASRVGKRKWDLKIIHEAMANGGGGWHGQGWLGKGKWKISSTSIGPDGFCTICGERLATIDLDPEETENFAESVASIAITRDQDSSFQKFQKWLDYYGPFEAVVDGANVGMFSQKRFRPSKINTIVNGLRHKLPSKRWPLVILHNRRVIGHKMNHPVNKAVIEKWKNVDALYLTPTGSNDDWYWLYAAIKFKCLIVTNDEMRDHTFQLLGNDFFPKWKERHQVHFSFSDAGPEFHMPPPYSVVIQESEKGHWHIPIATEQDYEPDRAWLCITLVKSNKAKPDSASTRHEESQSIEHANGNASSNIQIEVAGKSEPSEQDIEKRVQKSSKDVYKNLRKILLESAFLRHQTTLSKIEAAEELGNCVIDFQI